MKYQGTTFKDVFYTCDVTETITTCDEIINHYTDQLTNHLPFMPYVWTKAYRQIEFAKKQVTLARIYKTKLLKRRNHYTGSN